MDDVWVCGDCKSINRQRASACYHCGAPPSAAVATTGPDLRVEGAAIERSVRQYLPAWPLAVLAGGLIIVVAVLGLVLLRLQVDGYPALKQAFVDAMASGSRSPDAAIAMQSVEIGLLSALRLGLAVLALVAFAGWLGLATRNVPLLGGGVPSRDPLRAFVYTLIPIWNLVKVPGMVQDVLYRVDPRSGGALMVLAAWVGLVGSWLVSIVGGWAITAAGVRSLAPAIAAGDMGQMIGAFSDVLDQSMWLGVVTEVMIAVGAILLVVIMGRVEVRCAARDREVKAAMAGAGLPTPPAGPDWGAGPAPSAAPTPAEPTRPAVAYEPDWPASRPLPMRQAASTPSPAGTADLAPGPSPAAQPGPPPPQPSDPSQPPPPPPGAPFP